MTSLIEFSSYRRCVSLVWYLVAAIIASALKKSRYFFKFHAAARIIPIQRLTPKNPRNPVNPDSKPGHRIKRLIPSYLKGWMMEIKFHAAARIIPIQRLTPKNPRNPVNPDSKPQPSSNAK